MDHISDAISNSPLLKKLKENLSRGVHRSDILSHLSDVQKSEVHQIACRHGHYTVWLKSSYALYGIRAALRNFHCPIIVKVSTASR